MHTAQLAHPASLPLGNYAIDLPNRGFATNRSEQVIGKLAAKPEEVCIEVRRKIGKALENNGNRVDVVGDDIAEKLCVRWQPEPCEVQFVVKYGEYEWSNVRIVLAQLMLFDPYQLAVLASLEIKGITLGIKDEPREPVHPTYDTRQFPPSLSKDFEPPSVIIHNRTHHVVINTIKHAAVHQTVR
ncbi:hypothetical protein WJ42_19945 [Burkholderia cepacia]|nr:hypothetical protein WJ42_19945 [Burkholderia cepacia]KWC60813.1 hypothetical protein WL55_31210 [Burkholderia cepacia]